MFAWLRRSRAASFSTVPARPLPAVRIGLETLEQRENPSPWCGWSNFAPFGHHNTGGHSHQAPQSTNHGGCQGARSHGQSHTSHGHSGSHHGPGKPNHHGHCQTPPTTPPTNTAASLSGTVTRDSTGDGSPDSTVPGLTVELLDANGNLVASTTTASDGSYRFTGLNAGTYTIHLVTGEMVVGSVGHIDGSGDGTADEETTSGIELGTGQVGTNYNFMLTLPPA